MTFDLKKFLPYRLSVASNRISQRLAKVYQKNHDLDIPQWRVLAILASQEHMSATEVTQAASMDKVRISRTMSKLKSKGLINEEECQHDGRARRYRLTTRGHHLYQQLLPAVRACEASIFSCLDGDEIQQLHHIIDKLDKQLSTDR